jgi:hypothetical protein
MSRYHLNSSKDLLNGVLLKFLWALFLIAVAITWRPYAGATSAVSATYIHNEIRDIREELATFTERLAKLEGGV